jgi:serine/threonine protein kinase
MCQLNHPNIVGFIGAVTEPSNLCIITQYCSRGSLADLLLDNSTWMNFKVKVKFALEAAQGMLYLHQSNPVILHRDLKSDNLLVTSDWTIKVADFGLTRFISEKKQMTQVGTVRRTTRTKHTHTTWTVKCACSMLVTANVRTYRLCRTCLAERVLIRSLGCSLSSSPFLQPMWMAHEIIMGKKYTEKADVYAFGIILWEILTRLEPYEEKEPMQIVVEVVNDGLRPTMPADCADSPLVPLMRDCWNTSSEQRPPFEKIVERLKAIQAAIPPNDNSPAGVPNTSLSKAGQQTQHGAHVAGDVNSPTG